MRKRRSVAGLCVLIGAVLAGCSTIHAKNKARVHRQAREALEREQASRVLEQDDDLVPSYRPVVEPDTQLVALVHAHLQSTVVPFCNGETSVPSSQEGEMLGTTAEQPCGMVAKQFDDQAFYDDFVGSRCAGKPDAACDQKLVAMFVARLRERYPSADRAWIENHCTGYPDDCNSYYKIEGHFLLTHNRAVAVAFNEGLQRLERQAEYDRRVAYFEQEQLRLQREQIRVQRDQVRVQEERLAAEKRAQRRSPMRIIGRALAEAAESSAEAHYDVSSIYSGKTPVRCTSKTYGDTTKTTCR